MRLRLKSSFDISGFSAANQVILTALKKYGMINADNGSSMYISGAPDDRWDNDDLHLLNGVSTSDFEVVKMDTIYTASNVPQGAAPTISSFTASSTNVSAGTPVTLNWNTSSASYLIVSPDAGAVRGTSVICDAVADDHLYALRHKRLRPHHCHRHHHRSLASTVAVLAIEILATDML